MAADVYNMDSYLGGGAMRFTSERLLFRSFAENDFGLFYSLFSNARVMRYAFWDRYESEDALRPYFAEVMENNRATAGRKAYEFAVFLLESGTFIGAADIEISIQNAQGGCGEIGYFLLPEYWGKGYATETAKAMTAFAFRHVKLHRVKASCNSGNLESEKVLLKAGMIKEGEFRKARYKDGQWADEKHYSILIDEWDGSPGIDAEEE